MTRVINKIRLFVKDNAKSKVVAEIVKDKLLVNNYLLVDNDYDLAISIGGDGTFLRMVRECNFNNKVYYIGINSGNLGFLQDISLDEIDSFIECLNNNDLKYEELSYGKVKISKENGEREYSCLNEVVIRNVDYKTLSIPIYINDDLLEEFHGDGILVSTAIGSTAYNLSNGGPIIYNKLDVLILTSIAPINNKVYRTLENSLIISKSNKVNIIPKKNCSLVVIIDGKEEVIDEIKKIEIELSSNKIKSLRMKKYSFIKLVNDKLV